MRFAYADPPYPGQSKRLYGDHPDYAGEVDHAELIARLERDYPDGWALSTNAVSLQYVLNLCPPHMRIAAWNNTGLGHPGGRPTWWHRWEPVLVRGGRIVPVSDVLVCSMTGSRDRFIGAKPPAFTRWMLELLGAEAGDVIDDLFPGSGAVTAAIEGWHRQPKLLDWVPDWTAGHRSHLARSMRRNGAPTLEQNGSE